MLTDKEAKPRSESHGLSTAVVQHIAELARIELSDIEKKRFKKELSAVLDFVKKLNEVPAEGTEPLYQTTGLTNELRADTHRGDFTMDENLNKLLVGQVPHLQEQFVKVRSVKKKQ